MSGDIDVLIVGAGPVGLSLAVELARRDISFRLIDRASEPSDKSKALAIWSAALEGFSRIGVADRIVQTGHPIRNMILSSEGKVLTQMAVRAPLPTGFPDPVILPQSATERLLLERLAEFSLAPERPVELTELQPGEQDVRCEMLANGKPETVSARYVVGCDGAHSTVRHASGAKFEGHALDQNFLIADAQVAGELSHEDVHLCVSERGLLGIFPIRKNIFRFVVGVAEAPEQNPTLENIQKAVSERFHSPLELSKPEWLSHFKIQERKVRNYRVGRVFLAGDAAHIHSPAGGQGMNTGVQDAFNLAWKLEAVLRGRASDRLLDSYSTERSPVARHVLQESGRLVRLFSSVPHLVSGLRNALISVAGKSRAVQNERALELSGLALNYVRSPLTQRLLPWEEGGVGILPGERLREAELCGVGGAPVSLIRSLGGTGFWILHFAGKENLSTEGAMPDYLATIPEAWRSEVCVRVIRRLPDPSRPEDWIDVEGAVHRQYGANDPTAYLVRPDGFVAARCQPAHPAAIARYFTPWLA